MIAVDIATLLIIIGAVVAGITAMSAHHAQTKAIQTATAPDRRLGTAVRLLDRIVQAHETGFGMLPDPLLKEAQQVVNDFYSA